MELELIGFLGVGLVAVLVSIGFHVGVVLAFVGFLGIMLVQGPMAGLRCLSLIPYGTCNSYTLAIIPLFLLMGEFVVMSGAVSNLFSASRCWFGRIPGGLAIVSLVTNTGLAATTGSSIASTAMTTRIALPEMEKFGYDRATAAGVIAAGGTLAVLIPPSIFLIFYAMLAEVSVGKMLLAGFLPGLWNSLLFLFMILAMAILMPEKMPAGPKSTWMERIKSIKDVWGVMLIAVSIVVGLYGGIVTSTEVGGFGVILAFILVLINRKFTWLKLREAVWNATWSTSMIFMVVIGSFIFSTFLTLTGMSDMVADFIINVDLPAVAKFTGIILVFMFLGCFVDAFSMLAITLPIFLPAIDGLGWDIHWFGIIAVVMVEVATLTPPLGVVVHTAKAIAGPDVEIMTVFKAVVPFLLVQIFTVYTLYFFPQIVLFLVERANI
ncbi:MAG: TRAP transporter large permease [Deltaproteobacteria bacterium]|nr:MAG: TRAP transporter large permease [Deltaproteobacteria bacterium]